jgi:hypothetical protein
VRSQASRERDFRQPHKAQPINADFRPHEALKTLLGPETDPRPQGNDVPTSAGPAVDRVPNEIQAAPASVVERESGQTVGMVIRAADAAQNTLPAGSERKVTPTARSFDNLSVAMVITLMLAAALGALKFLLRRTYAKRGLVSGAIQRLEPPRDNIRLAELSWRPRGHQIEADDEAILRSVKKALDTIAAANAETASPSRQLQTSA